MEIITRKEAKAQGLKRYFTGKPCKRGHVEERHVSNGKCAECKRLDNRQYYAENREYFSQYREENRERIVEYARQYHAKNAEAKRQYYAENRERIIDRVRQYREENREKRLEKMRQYREENRGLYRANKTKRRAAKLDRTLSHDEELTDFVMQEASQQAKDMEEVFGTPFHVDHMIPMQGENVSGLHVYYNLQVIPASLNISKGNRLMYTKPLEWLADAA